MSAELVYSPLAREDLDGIWEYLAIECENVRAADKAVNKILGSLERLIEMPDSGTPLDARCITHSDYRYAVTGGHISFYRHVDSHVYIDRILNTQTDFLRELFGGDEPTTDLYV